jgi:hypothetical protein
LLSWRGVVRLHVGLAAEDGSLLRAMAGLGSDPQKAADVAEAMGRKSSQIAPTRAELIAMGLLYTPDHGFAAFTVPHFDQFILRAMPTLQTPPIRGRNRRGAM